MNREDIKSQIDKIERQKELAKHSLWGREYVHRKQITARCRLFADLDEQLRVLKEQYDALEKDEDDEW